VATCQSPTVKAALLTIILLLHCQESESTSRRLSSLPRVAFAETTVRLSGKTALREQQTQPGSSRCRVAHTISGEVMRGRAYVHRISGSDVPMFYLSPAWRGGWMIEILPKKPGKDGMRVDWAWPLNPPYRAYNSQNVSISYYFTAKEVIEYGVHTFRFPFNEADAQKALRLYDRLQSANEAELGKAMKELKSFPSGEGRFEILDSRTSPGGPENQGRGRIEWLKFKVGISLPCRAPSQRDVRGGSDQIGPSRPE
jgi:hypothetical protein